MRHSVRRVLTLGLLVLGTVPARAQHPASPPASERSIASPRQPSNERPGFRNPGGVARRATYYPAGDRFQNPGRAPGRVPSFGEHPSFAARPMQLEAQRVGTYRDAVLRRHIDAYGRPVFVLWFPWLAPW